MRFYQLTKKAIVITDDGPVVERQVEWFSTERAAIIERNSLFQARKLDGLKRENAILLIDVPTDKAGLLKFLQDNVTSLVVV